MHVPLMPPAMNASADRKVGEFDEIRVGPITITHTPSGDAGIWIQRPDRDMIAIFSTPTQVGIGIYDDKAGVGCNICLAVDNEREGFIQFTDNKGSVVQLTHDDVVVLGQILQKLATK